ncbi:DUF1501 domain-containing protein [Zavarzinella formosa]|uniref:DUF1501 domain-containing protein n=1 Tax=Zavarzinella formosa TaxID=360055 RepID=UPI0003062DA3|nr:DUF1501 domain-containing protein [Zavarzinella formosa]
MLRILGSRKRLCDGLTRRDWLMASAAGISHLFPASTAGAKPAGENRGFGSAKNVILLYPFGGPSHIETFDMKPGAPPEVRGEFKPIRSRLPGGDVCEYLPETAKVMDKVTVLRSLTHVWNFHGMQWATTGLPQGSIPLEETLRHPNHCPFVGSIFTHLTQKRDGLKSPGAVPDNIILPWVLSTRRKAAMYARPHASYLGNAYDPVWGNFKGTAVKSVVRATNGPAEEFRDPFLGITPDSRFEIAPDTEMSAEMTLDKLDGRRSLLEQFDRTRRQMDTNPAVRQFDQVRGEAFGLLQSPRIRKALDLDQEDIRLRERYGMTLFGQGALQARRLTEAGCKFVTVIWDEFGQLNSGWDTHVDHRNRMKNELLPGFDLAFSGLIQDLDDRGLLDETLVLALSEMGRTPRLEGNGRGHWGRAHTNLMAGAGVARGRIVGKTDSIGGEVVDRPLTAKDVLATVYHLCGFDPHTMLNDRQNRPNPLLPYGDVIGDVLG